MAPVISSGVNTPIVVSKDTNVMKHKVAFKQDDLQMQAPIAQDEFSSMPMVYEDEEAPKKSSGMIGTTLLGLTTAVIGGLIGAKMGAKGAKEAKAVAENALRENATIKKSLEGERTLSLGSRIIRVFNPNYKLTAEEIEARKVAKEAAKAAKKAEKAARKAGGVPPTGEPGASGTAGV